MLRAYQQLDALDDLAVEHARNPRVATRRAGPNACVIDAVAAVRSPHVAPRTIAIGWSSSAGVVLPGDRAVLEGSFMTGEALWASIGRGVRGRRRRAAPHPPDARMTNAIPAAVHDILTDKPTGYVATMRPDARMSVTPVGLLFEDGTVRFSTTKDRKKYRNLLHDDRITMTVAAPQQPEPLRRSSAGARSSTTIPTMRSSTASPSTTWASIAIRSTGPVRSASRSRSGSSTSPHPTSRSPDARRTHPTEPGVAQAGVSPWRCITSSSLVTSGGPPAVRTARISSK